MDTYIDSRLISLNSKDATILNSIPSYNSNTLFQIPSLLKDEYDIIQVDIGLINVQIPVSFYSINYTNNKLSYTLGSSKTIILEDGNYNANTLFSEMISKFLLNGDVFTIKINKINGCLTFSSNTDFTFNYTNSTIFKTLGFRNNIDYTSSSNILISPFPLNLAIINQLSIVSDNLGTNGYSSNKIENIISNVSVDKPSFGILTFESPNMIRRILKSKTINSVDIRILDQDGNLIDFNNQDWSLTLSINILRKSFQSFSTFRDVVNSMNLVKPEIKPEIPQIKNNIKKDVELELLTS
jgi:hypothetical protein